MTTNNRFPSSYTVLAGFAGAIAWSVPFLIVPFMPRFPSYDSPPYHIHLMELTISYSMAGMIAGGIFLIGLLNRYTHRENDSRPVVTFPLALVTLTGMAIGGAFAAFFGFGVGFSQPGYSMMASLDTLGEALDKGPEPFLSIGLIIGTALTALIICSFSGMMKQFDSPVLITLEIALKASAMAFIGRLLVCWIEFSSFVTYTALGKSILFFFLIQIAGGYLFGSLAWKSCSNLKST